MISMKIISVKSSHLALEGRVRNKEGFSWISVGREKSKFILWPDCCAAWVSGAVQAGAKGRYLHLICFFPEISELLQIN